MPSKRRRIRQLESEIGQLRCMNPNYAPSEIIVAILTIATITEERALKLPLQHGADIERYENLIRRARILQTWAITKSLLGRDILNTASIQTLRTDLDL